MLSHRGMSLHRIIVNARKHATGVEVCYISCLGLVFHLIEPYSKIIIMPRATYFLGTRLN